jgi:hypothetical protein
MINLMMPGEAARLNAIDLLGAELKSTPLKQFEHGGRTEDCECVSVIKTHPVALHASHRRIWKVGLQWSFMRACPRPFTRFCFSELDIRGAIKMSGAVRL